MLDFSFVLLYIIFPLLIFFLMKRSEINLFRVTIPSFVILAMFGFSYIGTLSLYFGWDGYRYISGVQEKEIMFEVFLFTSWSILCLVSGYVFSKHFLRHDPDIFGKSPSRPLIKMEKILLLFLFFCCLIVVFIFIMKIPELALWVTLTKGAKAASLARSKMGNDFTGKYHWYSLMMHDLLNVIAFTFFANWLVIKRWSAFLFFLLAFLCATFTSLMATEKGPFAIFVVGLFLVYLIIKKEGKIPILAFLKLSIFLLVPLSLFYVYFMGSSNHIAAVTAVISRVFNGQVQPAYHYLEFFPGYHDFLWGSSFPNPGGILPFKHFKLAVELSNWRFPNLAESGVVGSMPTIFWGELYANFGILGVIILPFFVGIGVYFVTWLANNLENTPLTIGLYVWLILHYSNLSGSGISGFILDLYVVGIFSFVLFVIWISNNQKILLRNRVV